MPKKILVIEDQPEVLELIVEVLEEEGYEVSQSRTGQGGLDLMKQNPPDLVVTDLAVPHLTGHQVVKAIKSSDDFHHIPVIMLSAFVREDQPKGKEVPPDAYLPKPFSPQALKEQVKNLIGNSI